MAQFNSKNGLCDDNAYAIACDKLGRVWVGTLNHGVSVYNGFGWENYDVLNGPIGERVFAIATCPTDGDVWMATNAGLTRYSFGSKAWTHFTTADGLPENQATSLAFDADVRSIQIVPRVQNLLQVTFPAMGPGTFSATIDGTAVKGFPIATGGRTKPNQMAEDIAAGINAVLAGMASAFNSLPEGDTAHVVVKKGTNVNLTPGLGNAVADGKPGTLAWPLCHG